MVAVTIRAAPIRSSANPLAGTMAIGGYLNDTSLNTFNRPIDYDVPVRFVDVDVNSGGREAASFGARTLLLYARAVVVSCRHSNKSTDHVGLPGLGMSGLLGYTVSGTY
jgi:hypothetical protein